MATQDNSIISITSRKVSDNEEQGVDARALYDFLAVDTRFNDWFSRRVEEYGFLENQDFVILLKNEKNSGRGRKAVDYFLTLEMAKELAMVEKNDKGREARRYFIECERRAKAAHAAIQPPKPVTPLLIDDSEQWYLAKMHGGSITRMVRADEPCAVKFLRQQFPHLEVVSKDVMVDNLQMVIRQLSDLSGQFSDLDTSKKRFSAATDAYFARQGGVV